MDQALTSRGFCFLFFIYWQNIHDIKCITIFFSVKLSGAKYIHAALQLAGVFISVQHPSVSLSLCSWFTAVLYLCLFNWCLVVHTQDILLF